ncbi:hypothetical protein [Spirosoma pomorum]
MVYKIFFSWQLDTDPTYNKYLISQAVKDAIKTIKSKYQTDVSIDLALDRADDSNQPGSPNVVGLIEQKIRECHIFLADVTFVNRYRTYITDRIKARRKGGINNNVVIELGQAKALIGDERIIKVMNVAYGKIGTKLPFPFDIEQDRYPITYEAESDIDLKQTTKQLASVLESAILVIIRQHETLRKKRFVPLKTFSEWSTYIQLSSHFVTHKAYETLFDIVKTSLSAGSVIRVVGLPGTGKTRTVFEALRLASADETTLPLTQAVLYYDAQGEDTTHLADLLHNLTATGERFVFVIDNASVRLHSQLSALISRSGCQSSLISIAPTTETQLPADRLTQVVDLTEPIVKSVCEAILRQKFPRADAFTLSRAVNFMGAFPALAVLLTQQDELNPYALAELTPDNWADQVLGSAERQSEHRAVLQTLSLFTEVGYERGEEIEAKWIAGNDLLTSLTGTQQQRWQKFKQIVELHRQRGIIHTIGRNIQIQPQHLALRLAEEWWESRDTTDAVDLLNGLDEQPALRTNFLRQIKHLRSSSTVQETVSRLCGVAGYFITPERALSADGASLLHFMADINPSVVTDCLARLLLIAPIELLEEARDGRRDLVWTLQKLCRYEATFFTSTQLLMRLAVAENEAITNNATGLFLQLFAIHLSGTEVSFPERISVLKQARSQQNEAYDALIIKAARAALAHQGFTRSVDSDEQLNPWKEFRPTNVDIKGYWREIVELISPYALSAHAYAEEAASILVGALRGLTNSGAAGLVLPIIDRIIDIGNVEAKNIRPALKSALRNGSLRTNDRGMLEQMLAKTEPTNLEGRLEYYVYSYADPTDYQDMGEATLQARAEALVPEFIQRRDIWEQTARHLLMANPFHATPFARQLAAQLSQQDQQWFVDLWITYFKQLSTGEKTLTLAPIVGFLVSAGETITDDFLKRLVADDALNYLAFNLIPASTTKPEHLESLLTLIEQKKQPIAALRHLQYSKVLTESQRELIQTWMQRIADMGPDGLWVALALTWNYVYERSDDESISNERSEYFKPLITQWSLNEELTQTQGDDFTQSRWTNNLVRIAEETEDPEVAVSCMNQLIRFITNQPDYYPGYASSNAYRPLRALLAKFFSAVWPILGDVFEHDDFIFVLADLLGSKSESHAEIEGLLFEVGDPDTLLDWYSRQEQKVQLRFANMLPIMKPDEVVWHPFTRRMLDTFGTDDLMRAGIVARMNTFGVNGSAAPLFEMHLALFEQLYQHSLPIVTAWARRQAEFCRIRIQQEKDWSDEGFPLDKGFPFQLSENRRE